MFQTIIVGLLFASALFYVGRLVYKSFLAKSTCDSGCGKCGVDFKEIEKKLQQQG